MIKLFNESADKEFRELMRRRAAIWELRRQERERMVSRVIGICSVGIVVTICLILLCLR